MITFFLHAELAIWALYITLYITLPYGVKSVMGLTPDWLPINDVHSKYGKQAIDNSRLDKFVFWNGSHDIPMQRPLIFTIYHCLFK